MSSAWRNREKRREREEKAIREEEERAVEERRYENLTMYMRIEEIEDIHDVKRILHEITEALDL